jgi:hypothetical protein
LEFIVSMVLGHATSTIEKGGGGGSTYV